MAGVQAEPAGDWTSPSVESTVAVNMGTDRSCPGFPGKKLKCSLPSHFELPVALWWLLPPDRQPDFASLCASLPTSGHQIIGAWFLPDSLFHYQDPKQSISLGFGTIPPAGYTKLGLPSLLQPSHVAKIHIFHIYFAVRCFWHVLMLSWRKVHRVSKSQGDAFCFLGCWWAGAKNGIVLLSK